MGLCCVKIPVRNLDRFSTYTLIQNFIDDMVGPKKLAQHNNLKVKKLFLVGYHSKISVVQQVFEEPTEKTNPTDKKEEDKYFAPNTHPNLVNWLFSMNFNN